MQRVAGDPECPPDPPYSWTHNFHTYWNNIDSSPPTHKSKLWTYHMMG